jgi:uncharacterized protein
MNLPVFRYHPDPLATGSIVPSSATCSCCGETRGFIYTSNIYCAADLQDEICPWCIADGRAAQKYKATFSDEYALTSAGIDTAIILEVTTRTPGFDTWQSEVWLSHCNDACAFLGDATKEDVLAIARAQTSVVGGEDIDGPLMREISQHYHPKSSPAFYKFQCLHCGAFLYAMDFD